jgi:hypothetical protein
MPEVAFELLLARGLDSEPSLDRGGAGVGAQQHAAVGVVLDDDVVTGRSRARSGSPSSVSQRAADRRGRATFSRLTESSELQARALELLDTKLAA